MEIIYKYTRSEVIKDNVLYDVSKIAQEAGIVFNTCITSSVHAELEDIPTDRSYESYDGRLWDLVYMLRYAIKQKKGENSNEIIFSLILNQKPEYRGIKGKIKFEGKQPITQFKCICHGGDNGEPCLTIMNINED